MSLLTIASETLVNIANAIRAKTGRTATMTPAQMVAAIEAIPTSGDNPIEKTVYTHIQDWSTSQSGGNTLNFYNTYFVKGNGLYYATIENNTASGDYKAVDATASIGMTKSNTVAFQRTINDGNELSTSWSFLLSAGAIVTVWFIPKGVFV